jgi:predicted nucleotide-binding protein (sugar kinase/HSP70/actin superfamily)
MKVAELFEEVKKSYVDFKGSSQKRELKKEMTREIERFSKMDHRDPAAYPKDWTADKKYKEELKRKGKKLPRSRHTKKFERMYGK